MTIVRNPSIQDIFYDIADETVDRYVAEIRELMAQQQQPALHLPYDTLFGKLKVLNAELTVKAIARIKTLRHEQGNTISQQLVDSYQTIIQSAVKCFVEQV